MHRENDKIERYKTYLRLEKALSANSIDAYLTDLDKLTNFVESEGKKYADVTYDDLQQFVARLHDIVSRMLLISLTVRTSGSFSPILGDSNNSVGSVVI